MFGPRFEVEQANAGQPFTIVMRGPQPGDAEKLSSLLCNYRVNEFITIGGSMTIKDEEEWLEKARTDQGVVEWLVAVKQDDKEELIGVTGLGRRSAHYYESGIVLADTNWWGKGIASVTHRFRTWYAFNELGLYGIDSGYRDGNTASAKALAGVGYVEFGRLPKCSLVGGVWRDEVILRCFNPATLCVLWPDGKVPKKILRATKKTLVALEYAKKIIQPR